MRMLEKNQVFHNIRIGHWKRATYYYPTTNCLFATSRIITDFVRNAN